LNDSAKYPLKQYGYPPKVIDHPEDLIGINSKAAVDIDLPLASTSSFQRFNQNRSLRSYNNQYHERAKSGFEYWNKDRRNPDSNNKPKCK
jgi:hypothetical protein